MKYRVSNGRHTAIVEANTPYWAAQEFHTKMYGPGSGGPTETPRFSQKYTDFWGNPLTITEIK